MIAGFVPGCKSKTDTYVGKVLVNGVGNEATVELSMVNMSKSSGPPRGPSQLATFTAVTEMRDGKKFIGQDVSGKGRNLRIVAWADPNTQGFEILADSEISLDITATYERTDGTVQPWTRHLEPGKHTIHLP